MDFEVGRCGRIFGRLRPSSNWTYFCGKVAALATVVVIFGVFVVPKVGIWFFLATPILSIVTGRDRIAILPKGITVHWFGLRTTVLRSSIRNAELGILTGIIDEPVLRLKLDTGIIYEFVGQRNMLLRMCREMEAMYGLACETRLDGLDGSKVGDARLLGLTKLVLWALTIATLTFAIGHLCVALK